MDLKTSTFLVTGGASGLGEGTVRTLHAGGANVVIADLQTEKGEALAKELGAKARFVKCDVTSEADGKAAVDLAAEDVRRTSGPGELRRHRASARRRSARKGRTRSGRSRR